MNEVCWRVCCYGCFLRVEVWEGDEFEVGELFQEWLREMLFWMLVVCSLVNLMIWWQVWFVFDCLMVDYLSLEVLFWVEFDDLYDVFWFLGLWCCWVVIFIRFVVWWFEVDF